MTLLMSLMRHVRLLSISFFVAICLQVMPCTASDTTQVCTIDANGQETCVQEPESVVSERIKKERICLPDGHCWDSLDLALVERFNDPTKGTHVELIKPVPFGKAQQVTGNDNSKTVQVLGETYEYMVGVYNNETTKSFRDGCHCRHEHCAFWAAIGECEKNPSYMLLQCAPVCKTCHQLSFDYRCPYDKDAPMVWGPGDLNKMFERITTDPFYVEKYEPNVLSKPPEGPWVITMENVATEEECTKMIELGAARGYERSQDVGPRKFDGTYDAVKQDTRTSHNTWCVDECYNHTLNQNVIKRVENITDIPDANSEYWQFLQYEVGQFYAEHHDYIPFHLERFQGPRIITVFLYLNDVEEGGGTHFTKLGITVQPKRGRVVIWPSVYDDDPNKKDPRTHHEALPVKKGIKYGANAWVHQRDFKEPYSQGCS